MIYDSSCMLRDQDREFDEKHRQNVLEEMPQDFDPSQEFKNGSESNLGEFDEAEDKVDVHDILPPARFTADIDFKPVEDSKQFRLSFLVFPFSDFLYLRDKIFRFFGKKTYFFLGFFCIFNGKHRQT
jgi:hypothetical protein